MRKRRTVADEDEPKMVLDSLPADTATPTGKSARTFSWTLALLLAELLLTELNEELVLIHELLLALIEERELVAELVE